MYYRQQIKELIRLTWHHTKYFYLTLTLIAIALYLYDHFSKEECTKPECYWKNIDKSRNASDIKAFDYENGLVIYRPEGKYRCYEQSDSHPTNDYFTDWSDVSDYYDLHEYYHD